MDKDELRSRLEPSSTPNPAEGSTECGPGCDCGTTGLGTKGKVIICVVVALVAAVVLARGFMTKARGQAEQGQEAFSATMPTTSGEVGPPLAEKATVTEEKHAKSSLLSEPLKSLVSLNTVAADKDAVFVYLAAKGQEQSQSAKIEKEFKTAIGKVQAGGTSLAVFTLTEDSQDYAKVTRQVPAPCVLAMVKGRGMRVVAGGIAEGKLLQALVAASRPSGSACP